MKCWMTRVRARCRCGCKFESFILPPEEQEEKRIARTRSGFAGFLLDHPQLLADLRRNAEAVRPQPPLTADELARLAALVADPAPDGQAFDSGLGPVCPRCEGAPAEIKVDVQVPEVVISLPLVTHQRWQALNVAQRRTAVAGALATVASRPAVALQLAVAPRRRGRPPKSAQAAG